MSISLLYIVQLEMDATGAVPAIRGREAIALSELVQNNAANQVRDAFRVREKRTIPLGSDHFVPTANSQKFES